jgi:hypothetical protein
MWEKNGIAWVNFALALYPKGNQDLGERWDSVGQPCTKKEINIWEKDGLV